MSKLTDPQKASSVEILQDLVRIDSTNESRERSNERRAEERIIAHLAGLCRRMGMSVDLHEVWPGRSNLTAHWPDQQGARSVAFQAHVDTVGVGGMTIEPFCGDVRDGKLWGRGSCDAKGSLATFLSALRIARERGGRFADKIHLIATIGEETGCQGATALMESGFRVDACVVGEPTRCELVTAHKGALWFKLIANGVASHTAMPDQGRNAIYAMGRAIGFVEQQFAPSLAERTHPLLGTPTVAVSMVSGGRAINIVAPRCEASVDCRFLPGQRYEDVARDFKRRLEAALPGDADAFELAEIEGHAAMEADPDGPLVRNLLAGCRDLTGQNDPKGVFYFADSGPFSQAGIQCVLFGPGDIAHAHKAEEFLELDQYFLAIETTLYWLDRHADRSMLA
ncbi:MAG: M20/M25/M40 family metallo-hydrolase [Phycisphaerae bacterium]|nr:M20/M25/M40 family metallo-hydrolase [Phycisphaerae bacterium]